MQRFGLLSRGLDGSINTSKPSVLDDWPPKQTDDRHPCVGQYLALLYSLLILNFHNALLNNINKQYCICAAQIVYRCRSEAMKSFQDQVKQLLDTWILMKKQHTCTWCNLVIVNINSSTVTCIYIWAMVNPCSYFAKSAYMNTYNDVW